MSQGSKFIDLRPPNPVSRSKIREGSGTCRSLLGITSGSRRPLMISPHDRFLAEELKNLLIAKTSIVDFRVFGSRARGDADDDSDLDIFIEVEDLDREVKRNLSDIVWDYSIDNGVVISPLFFSRNEVEGTPMRSSFILESIMNEGVRI